MVRHRASTNRPHRQQKRKLLIPIAVVIAAIGILVTVVVYASPKPSSPSTRPKQTATGTFNTHRHITATMFWAGEPPDADNKNITNTASTWVENWTQAFGGVDSPTDRCGYNPCGFTPKENAFYFALPFNDYDENGNLKPKSVLQRIPWYNGPPGPGQSLVKNHWIAVTFKGKTVYGQWEDAGPFGEDDTSYVFGTAPPRAHAGLDLSPAMNDYLHLQGEAVVSWRFIKATAVPGGPWKQTITTSGLDY